MNASGNITLTAELVCQLHKRLMRSSQVLQVTGRGEARLAYVNVGITRAETMKNVFGSSRTRQGLQVAVQYCPYYEVKSQLETFCRRFNVSAMLVYVVANSNGSCLCVLCVGVAADPGHGPIRCRGVD